VVLAILVTSCLLAGPVPAAGEPNPKPLLYDCGTLSLYMMLQLQGYPTDLRILESGLPAPNPRGYSMKELQDVALSRGLRLSGVLVEKDLRAIDRPMIAFVRQGTHGHFIVIRPVGRSGKLVQILDPNQSPDIIDKADLFSAREWSGLALVPDRPHWIFPVFCVLGTGALIGCFGRWIARRRQGRFLQTPSFVAEAP